MNHTLLDIEKGTCIAFIEECEKALDAKTLTKGEWSEINRQMNITRDRLVILNILMTDEGNDQV